MQTLNPRINVTVPMNIASVLGETAKRQRSSLSKVAADLIAWAIEEREDRYFSKVADEAYLSNQEYVLDNDDIWK